MQPTNLAVKHTGATACTLSILVPLHMYISFSVQQPYSCKLDGYFFLKATICFKSLYIQHLLYVGMYCVLTNKILLFLLSQCNLSTVISAAKNSSIYNEKQPYKKPHKVTQSKELT